MNKSFALAFFPNQKVRTLFVTINKQPIRATDTIDVRAGDLKLSRDGNGTRYVFLFSRKHCNVTPSVSELWSIDHVLDILTSNLDYKIVY